MTRLSNAVKQRDAAREEALLAAEKLNKLQEDLDAGLLQQQPAPAAATPPLPTMPSAGQAAALTPPAYAGGATEPGAGRTPPLIAMRRCKLGRFDAAYGSWVSSAAMPKYVCKCRHAGAGAEIHGDASVARQAARHARGQRRAARPHHAHSAQHGRASRPQSSLWCAPAQWPQLLSDTPFGCYLANGRFNIRRQMSAAAQHLT